MMVQRTRPWKKHYPKTTLLEFEIPEVNLYTFLETAAKHYADRTAIIFEEESWSYSQLKNSADRLANAWKQIGVKKGDRLGLMVSNHPLYVVSYYAALKVGMTVVQINPNYTPRELLEIFQDSGAKHLVIEPEALEKLASTKESYRFLSVLVTGESSIDDEVKGILPLIKRTEPLLEICPVIAKTDVAVIQYTGGTTGTKKGAMLTHYNLTANVLQSKALYGEGLDFGGETILTATPMYHVYGMTSGMNLAIYLGGINVIVKKFETGKILKLIEKYKPSFFPGVPKMYNALVNSPDIHRYDLNCFKVCSSGSAPLPVEVLKKFEELTGVSIGEGFGMSETSPTTHRNPPDGICKIGSIGLPLPYTDCRIVDENGRDLPVKAVGELLIKGPQVMLGYWNKPKETEQALKDGWLYTGDLATMDEDGYFYITGRKKEMIIVGGFNVYPQEVEGVLYEHPDILEAAVAGIPDQSAGEIVKAFLVPKPGREIDVEDVKRHCYRYLTPYKVPKQYEIRCTLPRNSVGKLLKRILIEESSK